MRGGARGGLVYRRIGEILNGLLKIKGDDGNHRKRLTSVKVKRQDMCPKLVKRGNNQETGRKGGRAGGTAFPLRKKSSARAAELYQREGEECSGLLACRKNNGGGKDIISEPGGNL